MSVDPKLIAYYNRFDEDGRLQREGGRIEFARTQEILRRHLPAPPASVLDVGGGAGPYSAWLAGEGYDVQLVDAVPEQVERARAVGTFTASVGEARALDAADGSRDVVLLFGPLYHLIERDDRLAALREAARVLRPGALLACSYITRWAPMLDGLQEGWIFEPGEIEIVEAQFADGSVRLPPDVGGGFPEIAYMHRPDEVRPELEGAGLELVDLVGVEGPAAWVTTRWDDPADREIVMRTARIGERDPATMALSQHLLAIARTAAD